MNPEVPGFDDLVEVGRGGFAVVYKATQPAFDRLVAIKVLTTPGLDEAARARFARECRAAGSLSWHPNVVIVFDQGTTPLGYPYLVAEYLEGGSLAARIQADGPLDERVVARYGTELASALQAAHDAGILHRDVKPQNVLVDRLGRAKLTDFGIAAVMGANLTTTGLVSASVAHAAPEVLRGQRATPQSDIYSLGSTLYTLLAGHAPFAIDGDTDSVAMVLRAATEDAPSLASHDVPEALAEIVSTAMAKDPADRYTSATAMAHALDRVAPSSPAEKPPADDDESPTRLASPARDEPTSAPTVLRNIEPSPRHGVEEQREPSSDPAPAKQRRFLRYAIAAAVLLVIAVASTIVLDAGDDTPRNADQAGGATSAPPGSVDEDNAGTSTNTTLGPPGWSVNFDIGHEKVGDLYIEVSVADCVVTVLLPELLDNSSGYTGSSSIDTCARRYPPTDHTWHLLIRDTRRGKTGHLVGAFILGPNDETLWTPPEDLRIPDNGALRTHFDADFAP